MVEVQFLGSGNAFCPDGRLHSLVLIDNKILVDAPPTIIPQLKRANISPSEINTMLITHWHGDHETEPHGYQLQHDSGLTILHCGDSGPCGEIEDRAKSAHIVIIEVGVPDGVPTEMHYKPSSISELANKNPKTTFLATHLFTPADVKIPHLPDNVIQANDGDKFTLNEDGSVEKIA